MRNFKLVGAIFLFLAFPLLGRAYDIPTLKPFRPADTAVNQNTLRARPITLAITEAHQKYAEYLNSHFAQNVTAEKVAEEWNANQVDWDYLQNLKGSYETAQKLNGFFQFVRDTDPVVASQINMLLKNFKVFLDSLADTKATNDFSKPTSLLNTMIFQMTTVQSRIIDAAQLYKIPVSAKQVTDNAKSTMSGQWLSFHNAFFLLTPIPYYHYENQEQINFMDLVDKLFFASTLYFPESTEITTYPKCGALGFVNLSALTISYQQNKQVIFSADSLDGYGPSSACQ
ncbi:MAG: hypothetical protein U1F57_10190 [bacterium]